MRVKKAIEVLGDILADEGYNGDAEDAEAIKLGIEALRRINYTRYDSTKDPKAPLPGETKD